MLKAVLVGFTLFMGCGSQREVEPTAPIPGGNLPAPGGDQFAQVQAVTTQYCLRCHGTSQFLKTEKAWDASEAKARLTARSMPPAGTNEAKSLSDTDRSFLISF